MRFAHSRLLPHAPIANNNLSTNLKSSAKNSIAKATTSITQWQQAAKQFKQLNEDIAKNYQDYSPKQLHEIGRLKGICVGAFSRYLSHTLDKSSNEIDGYLQGIEEICGKQDAAYPDDIEIEEDSVDVDSL